MAKKEKVSNEIPQLNLGPIMNMVVILIPLLLLSVVFTEVGVINITAPKLAMGPATDKPQDQQEEPLNLNVSILATGLSVSFHNSMVPPLGNCRADGPTICLLNNKTSAQSDLDAAIAKLKSHNDASKKEGAQAMKDAVNLYDWRQLYNELAKLKSQYPNETVINISAEATLPYSLVIRSMDVSRYKLEKDSYSNRDDFWNATYAKDGDSYSPLFPDPVLNLAK